MATDQNFSVKTVLKSGLYAQMKQLMIDAGWRNISSKPAADFDVLYSNGETGDKNLYFQMRETNVSNANSITTTNYCIFSVRLINKYTPGVINSSGIFDRPAEPWIDVIMGCNNSLPPATPLTLFYNVDKNRAIFAVKPPLPYSIQSEVIYIGMSNSTFAQEAESSGVLIAASSMSGAANQVYITNNAFAPVAASYVLQTSAIIPAKNRNVSNKVFMSEVTYGNSTEGIRGILDKLYVMVFDGVIDGDIIVDSSGQKYQIMITKPYVNGTTYYSYSSFPTVCLAFPIA